MAETNGNVLHLLRITLEALSPLSSGSSDQEAPGGEDKPRATLLIRDANGLPTIAGASLQGVLARAYRKAIEGKGEPRGDDLFGCMSEGVARAARLFVGFGHAHDSKNDAVVGLLTEPGRIAKDAVLALLAKTDPLRRDHVKLTHRLVSEKRHKFQRLAVPKGTRFSFELTLWGAENDSAEDKRGLANCAALMKSPGFRLGGAVNRGYGRVKVVSASYLAPDLAKKDALRRIRSEPPSAAFSAGEDWLNAAAVQADDPVIAHLELTPIDFWRIGGGGSSLTFETHGVRGAGGGKPEIEDADIRSRVVVHANAGVEPRDPPLAGIREPYIEWHGKSAAIVAPDKIDRFDDSRGSASFLAPGASIKGVLSHRAQFHFNRRLANGAGLVDAEAYCQATPEARAKMEADLKGLGARAEPLDELFGAGKERRAQGRQGGPTSRGRAARLRVDDAVAKRVEWVQAFDHNSIDRLTSGVREKAFYAEELALGGSIAIELTIAEPPSGGWDIACVKAFVDALDDLCAGQLAIGAKSYGYCEGAIVWSGEPSQRAIWEQAWKERRA